VSPFTRFQVMTAQSDPVEGTGRFDPKQVKMAPHGERPDHLAIQRLRTNQPLTANQIEFVNLIVDHLTAHGAMNPDYSLFPAAAAISLAGGRRWCSAGPNPFQRVEEELILDLVVERERQFLLRLVFVRVD